MDSMIPAQRPAFPGVSYVVATRLAHWYRLSLIALAVLVGGAGAAHGQGWMATGTYNGNSIAGRTVTGLGFQPDVVFVKSEGITATLCRTSTMPAGFSKNVGENQPLGADRITSLDVDGFTLGTDGSVNSSSETYHWVAMRAVIGVMDVGTYVGDGNIAHTIDVPGHPIVSMVLGEIPEFSLLKTATMGIFESFPLRGENPASDGITWHGTTSFSVGTSPMANAVGETYHYLVWYDGPETVETGAYLGDGSSPRTIPTVSPDPAWVLVRGNGNEDGVHRSASLMGDLTSFFQNRNADTGRVLGLAANAFDVGDRAEVNTADVVYNWVAFANPADANLRLTLEADTNRVAVGDTVTFLTTVKNTAVMGTTGILTTGPLPPGVSFLSATAIQGVYDDVTGVWDVGDLAFNETATLDVTARIEPDQTGSTIDHTVAITAMSPADADLTDNTATISLELAGTDVLLTLVASDTTAANGEAVVYTLAATNAGPDLATGLVIGFHQDPELVLQATNPSLGTFDGDTGAWDVGSLAPAGMATLTVVSRLQGATTGALLNTDASVDSLDQDDRQPANNTANATVTVIDLMAEADLELTMLVDDPAPEVGTPVTYILTVGNAGPDAATNVAVADTLPSELSFTNASASLGNYDSGTGIWSVGTLGVGAIATLQLTADVLPAAAGTTVTNQASVGADQADPHPDDNTAQISVSVPEVSATPYLTVFPIPGTRVATRPGDGSRPVLTFSVVNYGAVVDTITSLTVTNLTDGPTAPTQAHLDAEWSSLTTLALERGVQPFTDLAVTEASFVDGSAFFGGLSWVLAPGDTLDVNISGAPSLVARDGAELTASLSAPSAITATQEVLFESGASLTSGHKLQVDGFIARQATLHDVPKSQLALGSVHNLVLDVTVPSNGYEPDRIYGLNLVNQGSAEPGTDIASMNAWSDDGDGLFSAALDTELGELINSGERWQLTGLNQFVGTSGHRVFVTVDIAETARPARSIRMGLPLEYGPGVEMVSGNDGPVDTDLENKSKQDISVTDRVIVTSDWIQPGMVHPGDHSVLLLSANLDNTYLADDQTLLALTVTNASEGLAATTTAERDAIIQQVVLRLDDGDGVLGDLATDPLLGSASFVEGIATFSNIENVVLPAGESRRIFVTGDIGLTTAAEGDRIAILVAGAGDLDISDTTPISIWPLASDTDWTVDGMVADQITAGPVPVQSLGPQDGPVLALDILVPPNGYLADELIGVTLVNEGTATSADLSRVRLWADGSDGTFDAGNADDTELVDLVWNLDRWSSPVLSLPVDLAGLRLFASIDVGDAPTDSATVRLAVPIGGLRMESRNSGPLDRTVTASGTLVLSTSPVQTTVVFDASASTVGQTGVIRMTVRNAGNEPLTNVIPALLMIDGTAGINVGAVQPASVDLAVDAEAQFTWDCTSTAAGEVWVIANAQGDGAAETFGSAPTPTPIHTVYDPAVQLDMYPVASLPTSVNKGQTGLVPLTLTLVNPGDETVSDIALTSLRLRLAESPGGAGIVPADLAAAVSVSEGTNVYAALDTLPATGADIDLVFAEPAVITHREPVTLGIRLDLELNTTATSFVVSIEDASFVGAIDHVSTASVLVDVTGGAFPIRTDQANLAAPAGVLAVAMVDGPDHAAAPGQTAVTLATVTLTNEASDASSSAINVTALAFVVRDSLGAPIADPGAYLGDVTVRNVYQQYFQGTATIVADSILVTTLDTPVIVAADAVMGLELIADIHPDAPLGPVVPVLADPNYFTGLDANNGDPVPINDSGTLPGPRLDILGDPGGVNADGRGLLPSDIAAGSSALPVLELTLSHLGTTGSAPVAVDSISVTVLDAGGHLIDPAGLFSRLRVMQGAATAGDLFDPASELGCVVVPTSGLAIATGTTVVLTLTADLAPGVDQGAFQFSLTGNDIALRNAVTDVPMDATTTAPGWPLLSGLARIVVPAEELAIAGASLMPPLLAASGEAYPTLAIEVRNTATAGGGTIELHDIVVEQPARGSGDLTLGQVAASIEVRSGTTLLGTATGLPLDAETATIALDAPLSIPAAATTGIQVLITVREDAPAGALTLSMGETGLVAGPAGAGPGGIRIVPEPGQVLPLMTDVGNLAAADLAASYINFPNPFAAGRQSTIFAFNLPRPGTVTLRLLTPHGEPVATVIDREPRSAGLHQDDAWDGVNGRGVTVRNGVYVAEIVVEFDDGSRERHLRKVAVVR